MRWIQKSNGKLKKSSKGIPNGDAYFVDENGSMAIISDVLYVDGQSVNKGNYQIETDDTILNLTVTKKGAKISNKTKVKKGGDNSGNNSNKPNS